MKLHHWLLITHLGTALVAVASSAFLVVLGLPWWTLLLAAGLAFAAGLAGSTILTNQIHHGLKGMERIVAKAKGHCESPIQEFNAAGERLCEHSRRWLEAATTGREQFREVEAMLRQLDRRGADRANGPAGLQLRQVLRGLCASLDEQLQKVVHVAEELEECTQGIANGNEEQGELIGKTTASVERISVNIDSVSNIAEAAKTEADQLLQAVSNAADCFETSAEGLESILGAVDACERKMTALDDYSNKVLSIVETLGALASRTDLLALNASIESVRAGEHGRGFAIVAEEIRELAEQSTQATSEVAGLLGSMQLETRDSIALISQERSDLATNDKRTSEAMTALRGAHDTSKNWVGLAEQIAVVTRQQLNLVQDIVVAIETMSNNARTNRSLAERAHWNSDSLVKATAQFDAAIQPMRGGRKAETLVEDEHAALESMNDSIRELQQESAPTDEQPAAV